MPQRSRLATGVLLMLAACAGTPPVPPKPAHVDTAPPGPPAPVPLTARWVESGGATVVGPAVSGGTVVLLGGRRALLRGDGSLETEKASAPEVLVEIAEVPARGKMILVARGAHGVYRFDDPLGAPFVLARSEDPLVRIGAGPGVVAVWRALADLPRFLDVETGAEAPLAGLPAPPLHALAFADPKRGAAVFEGVGLAVTSDGGATWRIVSEAVSGDALRAHGVRLRRGAAADAPLRELRAFAYQDGPDGAVDVEGAALGRLEVDAPAGEVPLVRWLRSTGRDPLEAVASGGVDLPDGRALAASHGLVARVEPRTGAVDAIVDLARAKGLGPCGVGRSARSAWIACTIAEDGRDLFDPFGVVRVPLGEGPLTPSSPDLVRNGEAELRISPSGGVMLLAPCTNEDVGSACVRQPDGRWKTIAIEGDLTERGAGPLADGRLAFLRWIFDGDEPPAPAPAPSPAAKGGAQEDDAPTRRLHVSIVGLDGKEHHLPPIPFTMSRGYVRVQSPIEEDQDRTLRLVVEDGEGPYVITVPPGKESGTANRVPAAVAARLHAGRGIAIGEGRVLASLDGGATWGDVPATPAVLDAARAAAASYEDMGQLAVSEVGAKIGSMLRLGWAPADAAAAEPTPAPAAPTLTLPWSRGAPTRSPQMLTCTSQGPVAGTPPRSRDGDVRPLLEGAAPRRTPSVRHESAVWSGGRMLDTIALFEEEGPEARGGAPAKWTIRWHDPQEIGGKVRSTTIPVPKGATWGTGLRFAAASGARALFALRSGGKLYLARTKPLGAAEVVEVGSDLLPVGETVFGDGKIEAIAWARETQVFAWLPGGRPHAIARFAAHGARTLGVPTPDGVPLLLSASDWSIQRMLRIATFEKDGAGVAPPPAHPSLDGWTRLGPLPQRLDALPACTPKTAGGLRYAMTRVALGAQVDGVSEAAGQAVYDVRIQASEVCLAGVTATLTPDRRSAAALAASSKGKAPPPPPAFVRVDFMAKRAEGGDRGPPPAAMRHMSCSLGEEGNRKR
jgi:hypothetical protein